MQVRSQAPALFTGAGKQRDSSSLIEYD